MDSTSRGWQGIDHLFSPERLAPYRDKSGTDGHDLYVWNTRMCAALLELIAHLEVGLRNSIYEALAEHYRDDETKIPWIIRKPPLSDKSLALVESARAHLREQSMANETIPRVIANLSLGFWTGLFGASYEDIWRSSLHRVFPGSDGRRKTISAELEAIRKLRNRIAHHNSLLEVDVLFERARILRIAEYINPNFAAWLAAQDRTEELYRQIPVTRDDTVIVPATWAWEIYTACGAYVCQPNRYFAPVERIAFYLNNEIHPHFPAISERRDNVLASKAEVERLLASDDRTDRKFGRVLKYVIEDLGWSHGRHQIFLLTRHDENDPRHRSRTEPIPHLKTGRGQAFVRKQRYASVARLLTAASTDELVA